MKHDLRLILWYLLCPLYIPAVCWLIVFVFLYFVLHFAGFRELPEYCEVLGLIPVKWLDSIKVE